MDYRQQLIEHINKFFEGSQMKECSFCKGFRHGEKNVGVDLMQLLQDKGLVAPLVAVRDGSEWNYAKAQVSGSGSRRKISDFVSVYCAVLNEYFRTLDAEKGDVDGPEGTMDKFTEVFNSMGLPLRITKEVIKVKDTPICLYRIQKRPVS